MIELIQGVVDETNEKFSRVEQIKKFRLIDVLLTPEDEELTPTMKLKRSYVSNKYNELIESMYEGPYVELFARNRRKGWQSWGNELAD
mgnify:CR=1 FL=1